MNTKVVPNPEQKGWEEDGTTPNGTPIYKWESGDSGGGSAESAVLQDREEDQQVVSKFTVTANPTQDGMGLTNIPNKLVVDVDEKRTSFIAGSPNSLMGDVSEPWDVDIQGSLNIKSLGFPYSDMQYTAYGLSNYGGSLTLEANGTANFSSQVKMMDGRLRAFLGDAGKEVALSFKKIDGLETIRMYSDESGNFVFRDNENYTNRLTLDASGNATFSDYITAKALNLTAGGKYLAFNANVSSSNTSALIQADTGMELHLAANKQGGQVKIHTSGNATFSGTVSAGEIKVPRSKDGAFSGAFGPSSTDDTAVTLKNAGGSGSSLTLTANNTAKFSGSVTAGPVTAETMQIRGNRLYDSGTDGIGLYFTKSGNAILPTDNNGQLVDGGPDLGNQQRKFKNGFFSGTVNGARVVQDGSPVIDVKGLINTLSTLRNATKDETTLEGLRDSIGNAIGGLIEKYEAEIATMPAPETGTMETLQ